MTLIIDKYICSSKVMSRLTHSSFGAKWVKLGRKSLVYFHFNRRNLFMGYCGLVGIQQFTKHNLISARRVEVPDASLLLVAALRVERPCPLEAR